MESHNVGLWRMGLFSNRPMTTLSPSRFPARFSAFFARRLMMTLASLSKILKRVCKFVASSSGKTFSKFVFVDILICKPIESVCVCGCSVCECVYCESIFVVCQKRNSGNGALIELNRQKTRAERVCQVDSQCGAH